MDKNRHAVIERSLLDTWMLPADAGRPVAAIATTYEFDAALWESDLLPRFLGMDTAALEETDPFSIEREWRLAECYAAVLVDGRAASANIQSHYWDQIAVKVPHGIMHSKIALLQWHSCIRLLVGSANLTEPGYRYNHEVFYTLDFRNNPESPPRSLLKAFIDALRHIALYAPTQRDRMPMGPARKRLLTALDGCQAQLSNWRRMPRTYTARVPTRLEPIIIEPRSGATKTDLFSQVSDAWGHKANWVWVMSPFWDKPQGQKQAAGALAKYLRRNTQAWFICPGEWIKPHSTASVTMPRSVTTLLEDKLGECYISPVAKEAGTDNAINRRSLHAKALFLYDSQSYSHVYYAGSSNFTARGTGLVRTNFEAGIALIRRNHAGDDLILMAPGTSADYDLVVSKVQFAATVEQPEDEPPSGFNWPPFDLLVEYDAKRKELILSAIAGQQGFPYHRIMACAQGGATEMVLEHPGGRPVTYTHSSLMTTIPGAVCLEWQQPGKDTHLIFVPVQIRDKMDLPPPENLGEVQLDELIDYLASGYSAWQFFARRDKNRQNSRSLPMSDSLELVDTSDFLTTRVKRFSRAVAGLRRRIVEYPAANLEGLQMRFYSPFGPWALLKAICRGSGLEISDDRDRQSVIVLGKSGDSQQTALACFMCAELLRGLKWIDWHDIYQGPRSTAVKREWQKMLARMQAIVEQLIHLHGDDLPISRYARSVIKAE